MVEPSEDPYTSDHADDDPVGPHDDPDWGDPTDDSEVADDPKKTDPEEKAEGDEEHPAASMSDAASASADTRGGGELSPEDEESADEVISCPRSALDSGFLAGPC